MEQFRQHMKGRAVKTHGTWSVEPASIDIWICVLQFKAKSASTQHSNDKNSNQATSNESSTSQISGKLNHEITNPGVTDVRANPNDPNERANPDSNNKILPRAGAPASRTPPTTRVTRTQRATSTMAAAIEQNTCSQSCNNEIFSHSCNNECGKLTERQKVQRRCLQATKLGRQSGGTSKKSAVKHIGQLHGELCRKVPQRKAGNDQETLEGLRDERLVTCSAGLRLKALPLLHIGQ
ncbi:hypothetical protein GQ600_10896 [Phytophthora cactorum]|nr:hypothetical protein GQ600_10896 [Phytophthora cactorum]